MDRPFEGRREAIAQPEPISGARAALAVGVLVLVALVGCGVLSPFVAAPRVFGDEVIPSSIYVGLVMTDSLAYLVGLA